MQQAILVMDAYYHADSAIAAGVLFDGWTASEPLQQVVVPVSPIVEYQPGEFFRRELPCLKAVLEQFSNLPEILVIDGYVWLDNAGRPGLGQHLYEAINGRALVVGVAKTRFRGAPCVEVLRGKSQSPLFVSSAGVDDSTAAGWVTSMSGPYRIPTMIKLADQLTRTSPSSIPANPQDS